MKYFATILLVACAALATFAVQPATSAVDDLEYLEHNQELLTGFELLDDAPPATKGQAWAVFDGQCLADITRSAKTRMEAPLENGEPNMKKARLVSPLVKYVKGCYKIEVRHDAP